MKNYIVLLFAMFISFSVKAQQISRVTDKEDLFTKAEENRIDSLLQAYQRKSGNLVALYTDSADISAKDFGDKVYAVFKTTALDSGYSYILMMSRNHSFIFSTVNRRTAAFVNQQLLVSILENGFASFGEKRREEGVNKIFEKAMEFLDGLPKN